MDKILDVSSGEAREATIAALVTSDDEGKRVFGRLIATGAVSALDAWASAEIDRGAPVDAIGRAVLSLCGGVLGNLIAGTQVEDRAHVERLAKVAGGILGDVVVATAVAARSMRGMPSL